jgi:hypothetical protein
MGIESFVKAKKIIPNTNELGIGDSVVVESDRDNYKAEIYNVIRCNPNSPDHLGELILQSKEDGTRVIFTNPTDPRIKRIT